MQTSNIVTSKLSSQAVSSNTTFASAVDAQTSFIQEMEKVFGEIPKEPTQEAINDIRFDFNCGLRVKIPKGKAYRIRFVDLENMVTLYDTVTPADHECILLSKKRYYVNYRLVISEPQNDKLLFKHDFNANGKEVVLRFPNPGLGDAIGWFSYMERFQLKHHCKLTCVVADWFSALVKKQYPEIKFVSKEDYKPTDSYASYNIGIFGIGDFDNQPVDHRYMGLHKASAAILDVDDAEEPPRFDLSSAREIKEKYVCIAVQASGLAKMWNNPIGWDNVIDFLLAQGYRVLCIDKEKITGLGGTYNRKPEKAEDFTGDKPLQERIDLIKYADFFIGLSSGLSWLAWGCRIPVVLISGFTHPRNEFFTPYRVFNKNVCNSCWNDLKDYNLGDFWTCPRLGTTPQRFECSAMISHELVIDTIKKLIKTEKR